MNTPNENNADVDPPDLIVSAAKAAQLARVGRSTIQRALAAKRFPGAVRGRDGWEIPTRDLIAAGFPLHAAELPQEGKARRPRMPNDPNALKTQLLIAWDRLEAESAARRTAERLAEERAQHVTDLRGLLDVLRTQIAGTEGTAPMRNRP